MGDELTEAFYLRQLEKQRKEPRTEADRKLWLCVRQALIIALGGIEDYLGMERTKEPKGKR